MNAFEMVVIIVIVVTIGRIIQARYGIGHDNKGNAVRLNDNKATEAENQRLREEMRGMKERLAVLERLATDDTSGARLDREIDKLRDRS